MEQFMAVFMIVIGGFIFYSAITGKGPAYKNDYPKEMKEEANAFLRKFCWIVGPATLITGILDYLEYPWIYWISLGLILPGIIVYIIMFRRKFKKYLNKMK